MQCRMINRLAHNGTTHARRLSEQYRHREIHGGIAEVAVGQLQVHLPRGLPHHRKRAALAFADGGEPCQILRLHRHHVTLLRFVAPDFQRRHARLVIGHIAQLKATAPVPILHQFGKGIGEPSRTDVVNKRDGVVLTQLPAAIDHLLAAALHLRVLSLYRGKIEVGVALSAGH